VSGSILVALFGPPLGGWLGVLVARPAPWAVPLAFAVMLLVSRTGRPPSWSRDAMLRLHLGDARPVTNPMPARPSAATYSSP
jgi:hypothetical protein